MTYSDAFGAAVKRALGKRSYLTIARKMSCSKSWVGEMAVGRVPARDMVIALAEALGTDANALLLAAGYAPDGAAWSPDVEFNAGLRAMEEEFQEVVVLTSGDLPEPTAGPADVAEALAQLRRQMEARREARQTRVSAA